jgi:probable HAF family extracellular repeat protein
MKSRLLFNLLWPGLLALLVTTTLAGQTSKPKPTPYAITDLGTLGGPGSNSSAYDMNNAGWVTGSSSLVPDGPQHGYVWFGRGPLIDTGTLGGPNSEAGGPNLWGEAALISETTKADPYGEDFCGFGDNLQCLAAIWWNRKLIPLPTLPGGNNAQAYGLNNFGQVVGFSETGIQDSTCTTSIPGQVLRYQPVIWEPTGQIRKLGMLPGDTVGFAFGINNKGQAVGSSGLCSNTGLPPVAPNGVHAVLWEKDGTPVDLGSLGGVPGNVAGNINDLGQVAGTSTLADGTVHTFVWTKATHMHDIGALPGAFVTVAPCCNTLNNLGEVVGFSIDDSGIRAFVWKDSVMTDLNDLIPADSGWFLLVAQSLNDAGEIVGQGVINDELHSFLATPCDQYHAHFEGCRGVGNQDAFGPRPKWVLPEVVRQKLGKHWPARPF